MTRRSQRATLALLLGGVVASCSQTPTPTPGPGEDFRATAPKGQPTPVLEAPEVQQRVLSNGLTLYHVEQPSLPLVHVEIIVQGGSATDPEGFEGLAGFVADALKTGTKTRSAEDIADQVETLGSSLESHADDEMLALGFTALWDNFESVFDVAADVLLNPAFAQDEIERVRRQRLARLAEERDDPRATAGRVFRRAIFGAHPYGHTVLGTKEVLERIDAETLRSYYRKYFGPSNAAVIVVGNLTLEQSLAAVEERLGDWKNPVKALPPPPQPAVLEPSVVLVDRPNAPQSQLRIGHLGIARDDPDYYAVAMLNAVLGGLFHSRINMNLREDKGYTYGARSAFDYRRARGAFLVYTAVRSDVTAPAITEVLEEIHTIRREPVSEEELQAAKNRYSLSLPGYFQNVEGIAGMVATMYLYKLPLDYYQKLPENIAQVTTDDLRRVAAEHLTPEQLTVVVVGDRQVIEPGLLQLNAERKKGPLQVLDADGNVIQ